MAARQLIAVSRNLQMHFQARPRRFWVIGLVLLLTFCFSSVAQIPLSSKTQTANQPPQEQPTDPLGRSTPRGTISALIRTLHRDDFVAAARYMQIAPNQRAHTEELARDLKELMDRYFTEPIASISDSLTGTVDDGLPLDRERVPLRMTGQDADIILVRVADSESGQIWLISSDTLARVPALHNAIQKTWLESAMPRALLDAKLFGVSLGQWMVLVASLAGPIVVLWLFAHLLVILFTTIVKNAAHRTTVELWINSLRWPGIVVFSLIVHLSSVFFYLGSSLSFRISYVRFGSALLVLAIAWLFRRLTTLFFEHARVLVKRRGKSGVESLILLGNRVLNVTIAMVAIFVILIIMGVDTKAALTGVGIGGVALALGAQKTVENLLGGVFLLTDKAIAIGDTCCISNRVGTVEDITLRSVRLRTTEQTLLSIPAGVLSQANIENFATRTKTMAKAKVQLAYGTNAGQLKSILNGIQRLLEDNPRVEQPTAYVRLVDFGPQAIELEVFGYILTSEYSTFLMIRENLLLQIADVVESAGSHFARPTQFAYLERPTNWEARGDEEKLALQPTDARAASKRAS